MYFLFYLLLIAKICSFFLNATLNIFQANYLYKFAWILCIHIDIHSLLFVIYSVFQNISFGEKSITSLMLKTNTIVALVFQKQIITKAFSI